MEPLTPAQAGPVNPAPTSGKLPFYRELWVQVLVAVALAVGLGYVNPARAIAMKPLGGCACEPRLCFRSQQDGTSGERGRTLHCRRCRFHW